MKTKNVESSENKAFDTLKDRHILAALDESENARRALLYLADYLGGVPGFRVTLLHVVLEPPDEFFRSKDERDSWIREQRSRSLELLGMYKEILIQSGFDEEDVSIRTDVRRGESLSASILDIQRELGCCTVVVGRRGISKKEEFIFGSTSDRLVHSSKNCAIWVVE